MNEPACRVEDCEHRAVTVLVTEGLGGGVTFISVCQEHLDEIRGSDE